MAIRVSFEKQTAELPGLEEKDVEVKLANGILTLKREKPPEGPARTRR
ncbi:Hsp20/alpha crystallin family protein [Roseixanthobacter pseudopolyaromaticivorans]